VPEDRVPPTMAIDDLVVYGKSARGAIRLASPHDDQLAPRERQVLVLLDGHRTVGELSDLLGAQTTRTLIARLEEKGFAKRIDQARDTGSPGDGTRLLDDENDAPRTRPVWYRDWFALINLAMAALMVAIGIWLFAVAGRQPDTSPGIIDVRGAPAPTPDRTSDEPETGPAVKLTPLSHLPALSGSGAKPHATKPGAIPPN